LGIASLSAELREKRPRGAIEHLNRERTSIIKLRSLKESKERRNEKEEKKKRGRNFLKSIHESASLLSLITQTSSKYPIGVNGIQTILPIFSMVRREHQTVLERVMKGSVLFQSWVLHAPQKKALLYPQTRTFRETYMKHVFGLPLSRLIQRQISQTHLPFGLGGPTRSLWNPTSLLFL